MSTLSKLLKRVMEERHARREPIVSHKEVQVRAHRSAPSKEKKATTMRGDSEGNRLNS